jgi:hypothetical protein
LTKRFVRPQGSFGARAVGNAIHAFVERISRQIATSVAAGTDAPTVMDQLLEEIPSWVPAVRATLRAGSLPADEVDRASYVVERALKNLLQSQDGRWILLPHRGAEDESAWRSGDTRVRLDRSFFAGSKPRSAGDDTLWIIDFKTADRAEAEQNAFLQAERTNYAQQLRTYAQMRLRTLPAETPIMLALFYPLMGRLISWRYEPAEEVEAPLLHVPAPEAEEQEPPTNTKGQFSLFG